MRGEDSKGEDKGSCREGRLWVMVSSGSVCPCARVCACVSVHVQMQVCLHTCKCACFSHRELEGVIYLISPQDPPPQRPSSSSAS